MLVKYKILKGNESIPGVASGASSVGDVLETHKISHEFIVTVNEEPVELEYSLEDLLDGSDSVDIVLSTKVKNA